MRLGIYLFHETGRGSECNVHRHIDIDMHNYLMSWKKLEVEFVLVCDAHYPANSSIMWIISGAKRDEERAR